MKLFVARHGQTTWNAQNKVCGITDEDMSNDEFFNYTLGNGKLEEYEL